MERKVYETPIMEVETIEREDVLFGSGYEDVNNVQSTPWDD